MYVCSYAPHVSLRSYVKGIQLCGNLWLRNVFTSEQIYDNPKAFPRDMRLFVPKVQPAYTACPLQGTIGLAALLSPAEAAADG